MKNSWAISETEKGSPIHQEADLLVEGLEDSSGEVTEGFGDFGFDDFPEMDEDDLGWGFWRVSKL